MERLGGPELVWVQEVGWVDAFVAGQDGRVKFYVLSVDFSRSHDSSGEVGCVACIMLLYFPCVFLCSSHACISVAYF
jgi:hypothetical protein